MQAIDAMKTTMFTPENGDRDGVPNVVIIVTDGYSNINREATLPAADAARAAGITVSFRLSPYVSPHSHNPPLMTLTHPNDQDQPLMTLTHLDDQDPPLITLRHP